MPTPAERKALLFLAGVIVLGASVRVVRAARDDGSADAATRQALTQQLAAVESARAHDARKDNIAGRQGRSSARRSRSLRGRSAADSELTRDSAALRVYEPLGRSVTESTIEPSPSRVVTVDLDVASTTEIEALPRIGPVLAARIVEDRLANGPFGSLEGFERVRGVGPSLARTLHGRVTFSGTARPSNAVVDPRLRSLPPSSKSSRRERRK
jgi:DNA uptake protein ComE-like DNA-binding protein